MLSNSYLRKKIEVIEELENLDMKRKLINSLTESVNLRMGEVNGEKHIASPSKIASRHGIPLTQLVRYGVVVDYIGAVEFLDSLGFKIEGKTPETDKHKSFRNTYHGGIFNIIFGREPEKLRTNIYTYAEVMSLVGHKQVFKPPVI